MIEELRKEENAVWVKIRTTPEILELIVEKGSICIDGISLTVAEVSEKKLSGISHSSYRRGDHTAEEKSWGQGESGK